MRPTKVTPHPSPNHNARRGTDRPTLVVLHFTGMDSTGAALERLCNPVSELSSHYMIDRSGNAFQLVDEDRRAWHAGAGSWGGLGDVNSRSVGIELDNDGQSAFSPALMAALRDILHGILERHEIPPEGVIGHQDMAPRRKADPGPLFDWQGLANAGLAVMPSAAGRPALGDVSSDFWQDLCVFGYPPASEVGQDALLRAFRNRFRAGPDLVEAEDAALARDLATRFPFDRGAVAS